MRRAAVLAVLAGLVPGAPSSALLPSVCNVVATTRDSRVMVGYDSPAALRAVRRAGGAVVGRIAELGAVQVSFGTQAARDAAVTVLAGAEGVRWVQPERTFRAHRSPNDPLYKHQWALARIGAPKAWDVEVGTTSAVTVAVIDTGVAAAHPDLAGRVRPGRDLVAGDDVPDDEHGHGTHVAGIVAARTGNRVGVAGISWGATVLAIRALDAEGAGSDCDIALGLVSAADAGAKVVNLSLGSEDTLCGIVTQEAVDYARDRDALIVASSGNGAREGNGENTPANCDGVLAVGATDSRDRVASFSTHHPYVDVSAPGVAVMSTYWVANGGRAAYAALTGTSMAAPVVSGLAALLRSKYPSWTADEVAARIEATADDRGVKGRDEFYGTGRVNAARALR